MIGRERGEGNRGTQSANFFHPWVEQIGRNAEIGSKKYMDTSSTFLFEVVFKDMPVLGESQAEPGSDRSIIVEVEPDRMVQEAFPHSAEDDRQFAKDGPSIRDAGRPERSTPRL